MSKLALAISVAVLAAPLSAYADAPTQPPAGPVVQPVWQPAPAQPVVQPAPVQPGVEPAPLPIPQGAQAAPPTYGPWQPAPGYVPPAQPSWMQPLPAAPEMHPFSVSRRTSGQVLVVLGLVHGLSATITDAMTGPFGALFIGAPLHTAGAILCSIGAPLWMSGSKLVPAGPRAASAPLGFDVAKGVTLEPNATGVTLRF